MSLKVTLVYRPLMLFSLWLFRDFANTSTLRRPVPVLNHLYILCFRGTLEQAAVRRFPVLQCVLLWKLSVG